MPTYETFIRYAIVDGWRTIEAAVTARADGVTVVSNWSQKIETSSVPDVTREVVAVARRHADEMLITAEAAMGSTP